MQTELGIQRWGHLVALVSVWGAPAHEQQAPRGAASQRSDEKALPPLLHDPVLGQELGGGLVHLSVEHCCEMHTQCRHPFAPRMPACHGKCGRRGERGG